MNKKTKDLGNVFKISKVMKKVSISEKEVKNSETVKYGKEAALTEHLLSGNKISFIEASIIFGIGNLWNQIRLIKKKGFIIKSQKVSMAKIIRRMNEYCDCTPPTNLPTKEITMHEWWVSK